MNTIYLSALVILLIYGLYWIINLFLAPWLSIISVILLLYYQLRLICYVLVYPGSFKLYLRINQNHYGILHAKRAVNNLSQLEAIFNKTESPNSIEQIFIWLEFQSKVFSTMQSHSQQQLKYANAIKNLLSLLKAPYQGELLITQVIRGVSVEKQIVDQIKSTIEVVQSVANLHLMQLNKFDSLKRWCSLQLFGGLNEMRAIIQLTNPEAKRIFIVNGKNKIDCMYLINQDENQVNNTILFCNPNGGYYEYMFYDCNWFRYYENKNVNVIVWNYRSYGQSTGKLNPTSLLQDAQIIVNYFREHFNILRFGIHGYSLGGSIASEIALQNNLDFLIVDRSFSSLGQIASKCFNSHIRFLLNLITDWDKPHYMSYWNFRGQKLIIQDSRDEVIPYEAQLQVAIAKEWFSPYKEKYFTRLDCLLDKESEGFQKFFNSNVLNSQSMKILSASINRIMYLLQKLHQLEESQESNDGQAVLNVNQNQQRAHGYNQSNYVEFITDDDLERLQPYLYSLIELLFILRYKDTSLTELLISSGGNNIEKIQSYFACCFTFGMQGEQNFINQFTQFKQAVVQFLANGQNQNDCENVQTLNISQIQIDLQIITDQISKIVERFSEYLDEPQQPSSLNDSGKQSTMEMKLAANSITRLGQLLNVKCGHNNNLNELDFGYVNQFFRLVGIN